MTKKNEQNHIQQGGGSNSTTPTSITNVTNTNTTSGVVIVQQQSITEQQHFLLPTVNNSAPMIITTPLAVPSMITQLPTTTNPLHQSIATAATTTTFVPPSSSATTITTTVPNTSIQNKTTKSPGQDRLVCSLCNKVYRSSAGLRYHKRKRHRDEGMLKPTQIHRVRCLENGCVYQMLAISDLRNHLANHHLKPEYKTTEEKKFNSFAEFTEWKSSFEQSSGSKYVKNCGSKGKSENQTTEYYYCNRTGLYKQTRQGWRRNSKPMDSLRCGIHCTSSMKVDISRNDQISVQYYPAHYGHTAEPPLQAPATAVNGNNTSLSTTNGELVEQPSVQQQTIPPIQTVVQAAVQQTQTTTTTDHCVRLQHQHHAQTSSIIINIAPVRI
ncbi:unnamed protein product [Rotaria socialis]|uniref:C2H2-type domain-containing protein n=1 Tax=Rotaria socialis TaxID=392032 RepID=A0A820N835_9BILA|nr:unnamed protein product [Rotaria socialis]CAF4208843.1 unnamed protein product [Rotaria socialis]CAF4226783.1 unnamed protein product [Rotaria socialis]CAF4383689.1 unnamed protein product [Rotaria socialis]CAF4724702.1 unnamed protein product [Rotaria socialis]